MKIKDLMLELKNIDDKEAEILISSDEELNELYSEIELCQLEESEKPKFCLYGLSRSAVER